MVQLTPSPHWPWETSSACAGPTSPSAGGQDPEEQLLALHLAHGHGHAAGARQGVLLLLTVKSRAWRGRCEAGRLPLSGDCVGRGQWLELAGRVGSASLSKQEDKS